MAKITFDQVSIQNLGPFKEKQTLNLNPAAGRPVILIKALNGSGKTTLLTLLQIGLYGYKAINPLRKSEYDQLISGLRRNDARGNASVEIRLIIEIGSNVQAVVLRREWDDKSTILKETFTAISNGIENIEFTENWDQFINGILPVELVQLFLFDGEKIEALANPEKLPELLKRATEVFLGLGGIDTLRNDLKALERRLSFKGKEPTANVDDNEELLQTLQRHLDETEERLALLVQKQGEIRNNLHQANRELDKFTIHARRSGIESYKKAAELKSNVELATKRLHDARQDLIEALENPVLPLAWLTGSVWDQYKTLWNRDAQAYNAKLITTEFEKRDAKILTMLSKLNVEGYEVVEKLLNEDIAEFKLHSQHTPVLSIGADPKEIEPKLVQATTSLSSKLNDAENAADDVDKAERIVGQIPAEEQLADIFEELQMRSKAVSVYETKLQETEKNLEETRAKHDHFEARLNSVRQKMGAAFSDYVIEAKSLEAAARAKKTLSIFRDRLLASKAEWLSQMITKEFKNLLHKQNLISDVVVNPTTYSVSIKDVEGQVLPIERLSAGERQILAVALLTALISKHKGCFPVVVDTPLARLDRTHRNSLIHNFFGKVSHQVIVLSTDEEVDGIVYNSLFTYINQEYVLDYDDKYRCSKAYAVNTQNIQIEVTL